MIRGRGKLAPLFFSILFLQCVAGCVGCGRSINSTQITTNMKTATQPKITLQASARDFPGGDDNDAYEAARWMEHWFDGLSYPVQLAIYGSYKLHAAQEIEWDESPWLWHVSQAEWRCVPDWARERGGHLEIYLTLER